MKEGFRRLSRTLQRSLGMNSVRTIQQGITSRPVITIGRDQSTGKSTLGRQLAEGMVADCLLAGELSPSNSRQTRRARGGDVEGGSPTILHFFRSQNPFIVCLVHLAV